MSDVYFDTVLDDDMKVVCRGEPEVVKGFLKLLPKAETDHYQVWPGKSMKTVQEYLAS